VSIARSFSWDGHLDVSGLPRQQGLHRGAATRTIAPITIFHEKERCLMVSAISFDDFTLQKDCALCESFQVNTSLLGYIKEWWTLHPNFVL
jgi:hypothetical protein